MDGPGVLYATVESCAVMERVVWHSLQLHSTWKRMSTLGWISLTRPRPDAGLNLEALPGGCPGGQQASPLFFSYETHILSLSIRASYLHAPRFFKSTPRVSARHSPGTKRVQTWDLPSADRIHPSNWLVSLSRFRRSPASLCAAELKARLIPRSAY